MTRKGQWFRVCCLSLVLCAIGPGGAEADEVDEFGARKASRPVHALAQAGVYGALGGPASWGPVLSIDLLPGSFAGRYGIRGEWRGYRRSGSGSVLAGLLFEAGASRPQLALKLIALAGLTADKRPIVGAGIEWSLWFLGPLGVSTLTDLQLIIDGTGTRPVLSGNLVLHLGR